MAEEEKEKTYTYQEIADRIGVPVEYLHRQHSYAGTLIPDRPPEPGDHHRTARFSAEAVEKFLLWYSEQSFRGNLVDEDEPEPLYTYNQAVEYLGMSKSAIHYHQRKYGRPYPDGYQRRKGRTVAVFKESTLADFLAWYEDKPSWKRPG